jgi:hypothetical protein
MKNEQSFPRIHYHENIENRRDETRETENGALTCVNHYELDFPAIIIPLSATESQELPPNPKIVG